MKTPGVTVRPLVLVNGHAHFNEVFFEDVRVPKENLVGPLNEGWKVTITTLMFERGIAGGGSQGDQIRRLAQLARNVEFNGQPAWQQSWVRDRLSQLHIEHESLKYTRLRSLTKQLRGLPPGPEGSMLKLCSSELGVRIAEFASELLGHNAIVDGPSEAVPDAPRWVNRVLRRPPVYDFGRHERDSAQYHGRTGAGPAQGLGPAHLPRACHSPRRTAISSVLW